MNKHKSEDYKISAVKYYLKCNNYTKTCEIFDCSERSLKRWTERYQTNNNIKRQNKEAISYKIKNKHIKYVLDLLEENKHLSMEYLVKTLKDKFDDFNITPQHLGVIKGFRNLFRNNKFEVYLVNEFRTSCRCNICQGECETFRICQNPKPWKKETTITRNGLIRCKTCKVLWNRDENSSCNILTISKCAINKKERPIYLSRQPTINNSDAI